MLGFLAKTCGILVSWPGIELVPPALEGKVEAAILWPPDAKSWVIRKDPDAGKDWGQEEKVMTEDELVGWDHWSMDMSLSKLRQMVKDR